MIGDFCGVTKYLLAIYFREKKPLLASPMAQVIKNLLSMQETKEMQVQSLGQEYSPGGGSGNPLQYSCLENLMDREVWQATVRKTSSCPKS